MDLDPILSALSKLEQSINNRYNDLNIRYNDLNNKITNLDEKVESILSIVNNLHTTSPTVNVAAPDTPKRTK
jgi:chaperonin cofactor prefoldin